MIAVPHLFPRSLVIAIVLGAALPVFSQVSIGNRIGASWSRFTFASTNAPPAVVEQLNDETKAVSGFTAALPVEIQFADYFALQPELGYLLQGWTTGSGSIENQVRMNYGQVSALAKVTLGRRRLRVFAQAGPSWSMLLSVRSLIKDSGILISDGTVYKDMDPFTPSTWSVLAGGGLVLKTGDVRLVLDYRYAHGILEPLREFSLFTGYGSLVGTFGSKSNAHLLTLGILVPLGTARPAPVVE